MRWIDGWCVCVFTAICLCTVDARSQDAYPTSSVHHCEAAARLRAAKVAEGGLHQHPDKGLVCSQQLLICVPKHLLEDECAHTYLHTGVQTYTDSHIHTHTLLHTYIRRYIYSMLHTHTKAILQYIHTCMYDTQHT